MTFLAQKVGIASKKLGFTSLSKYTLPKHETIFLFINDGHEVVEVKNNYTSKWKDSFGNVIKRSHRAFWCE